MNVISCISPVESSGKRHFSGGHLTGHYGRTRNEYVNITLNSSIDPLPPLTFFLLVLSVILPIIMQRLEKYRFMQRITYLHGPIQVMMVGVL